ncbi:MAG: hypothetical protein AAF958_12590 [Planctomycetota bacterium]
MSAHSATADPPFVFSPDSASPIGGPHVDSTRREIAALVREVAAASRVSHSGGKTPKEFADLLVTRTAAALAAGGVLLWRYESTSQTDADHFEVIARCGAITDASFSTAAAESHVHLLAQVVAGGQPVVVPPSPESAWGDSDSDQGVSDHGVSDHGDGRNPAAVPAAIVPVPLPGGLGVSGMGIAIGETGNAVSETGIAVGYVLEAFVAAGGGVGVQRGYLRFVAQMADLAGVFFSGDHTRRLVRCQHWADVGDKLLDTLQTHQSAASLREQFVDLTAETFGCTRVAWCGRDATGAVPRVMAVSHCEKIDHSTPQIRNWIEMLADISRPSKDGPAETTRVLPSPDHRHFLILESAAPDDAATRALRRLWRHALELHNAARRVDALPLGRLLAKRSRPKTATRWASVICGVVIVMLVAAGLPMPNHLMVPMTLRPAQSQTVYCTRDAIVRDVFVKHDQPVTAGQPLLRLEDPGLADEKLSSLCRRDVLEDELASLSQRLLDPAVDRTAREEIHRQRRRIRTQIAAVETRLQTLSRIEADLTLTATGDGVVDAWQIDSSFLGKPLRRGELLLRIVRHDSDWIASTEIQPRDLDDVAGARDRGELSARLCVAGSHLEARVVEVNRLLPISRPPASSPARDQASGQSGGLPPRVARLEFRLQADQLPGDGLWRDGAGGTAYVRCGNESMIRWIWGDAIDWTRARARLLIAPWDSEPAP